MVHHGKQGGGVIQVNSGADTLATHSDQAKKQTRGNGNRGADFIAQGLLNQMR